jgi:UDP-GlcNAc:undecaprenyl-phosphate GlcNAc-1-phosphate transferase
VGFLPHNFHPARLFMGDSGSLMLGLLLAAATISMTGNIDPSAQVGGNPNVAIFLPVVLPLAILSVPLLDVLLAVVRRTRAGRRPWHPDTEHLHHRMLRLGHTHVQAVLLLYLWAAVVALGVVSFAFVSGWVPIVVIAMVAVAAAVLTLWLPRWMPARRL